MARVGSRERNARDEMARLRGYQYGGAIGRQAAAMGPAIAARIPSHIPTPHGGRPDPFGPQPYMQPWRGQQAGGRVGFKTGGRIPRKKGAKFI